MRIAVAGGTGGVGSHVVRLASEAGHEVRVLARSVPWTILRTTQFFEFAEQRAVAFGPWALVVKMRSQPLAAVSVAKRLIELAEGTPQGHVPELAGPDELWMADLARMVFETHGERRPVIQLPLPGKLGRALRNGGVLPGKDAQIDPMGYEDWLADGAR